MVIAIGNSGYIGNSGNKGKSVYIGNSGNNGNIRR